MAKGGTSASPSSLACSAHVHSALQIVQVFRECQNSLSALEANVSALSNISQQRHVLEGAMRRCRHCFESPTSTSGAEEHGEPGRLHTKTNRVAVAPLGVLVAFTPATTEALLGQHQDDQQRLLSAIHQVEQKWAQRTQRAQSLLGELEASIVANGCATSVGPSVPSAATAPPKKLNEAAKRKAAAADYMNSLYGTGSDGASVSAASSPPRPVSSVPPASSVCTFYQQRTGLASLEALFEACRGLVCALLRMRAALQGLSLALRDDLLSTLSGARSAAVAVSEWLEECRGEATVPLDTASFVPRASATKPVTRLLTWDDAVLQVEPTIAESWQRWKDGYLSEASAVLLTVA